MGNGGIRPPGCLDIGLHPFPAKLSHHVEHVVAGMGVAQDAFRAEGAVRQRKGIAGLSADWVPWYQPPFLILYYIAASPLWQASSRPAQLRHIHQHHVVADPADFFPGDRHPSALPPQQRAEAELPRHDDGRHPSVAGAELNVRHPSEASAITGVDHFLLTQVAERHGMHRLSFGRICLPEAVLACPLWQEAGGLQRMNNRGMMDALHCRSHGAHNPEAAAADTGGPGG